MKLLTRFRRADSSKKKSLGENRDGNRYEGQATVAGRSPGERICGRIRSYGRGPTSSFVRLVEVVMPIAVAAMVGPADIRVRRGFGLLTCVALKTGACLCLFDPETKVAGMAHVTSGLSPELNPIRPGTYADSAIDALVLAMERTGAHRGRLVAALTGGVEVPSDDADALSCEVNVCRAVQKELEMRGVSILGTDFGGSEDRSVIFDLGAATIRVRTQAGEKMLVDLAAALTPALQVA